jgi:hypothetical protein
MRSRAVSIERGPPRPAPVLDQVGQQLDGVLGNQVLGEGRVQEFVRAPAGGPRVVVDLGEVDDRRGRNVRADATHTLTLAREVDAEAGP